MVEPKDGHCGNLRICVAEGSTTLETVKGLFPDENVVPRASSSDNIVGLIAGDCNVISNDAGALAEPVMRAAGYTGDYSIGLARFSKEPLALVTRQDDPMWSDFVFWVVQATFYAEEAEITQADAADMPSTLLFGPDYADMLKNAIAAGGNFGEIYRNSIEAAIPRSGLNLVNDGIGPQLYALPGV